MTNVEEVNSQAPVLESTSNLNSNSTPVLNKEAVLKKSVEQIALTEKQLTQIKEKMAQMIDSMNRNQSIFSRSAAFWGNRPLWQKIIVGIVLIVPTLVIGIMLHFALLIVLSVATLLAFVGCSILLDNHHNHQEEAISNLKTKISSLADMLADVIGSLDKLREKLGLEIDKFEQENEKLSSNINDLDNQFQRLTLETAQLNETEHSLWKTKEALEKTVETFSQTIEENKEFLIDIQKDLAKVTVDYHECKNNLSEKIAELKQVEIQMSRELEMVNKIATTFYTAVEKSATTSITDEVKRIAFQGKLAEFINDTETSYDKIAQRLCEAQRELSIVKEELKLTNERHDALLERQEREVKRLESRAKSKPNAINLSALLSRNGLYGENGENQVPTSLVHNAEDTRQTTLEAFRV